ncbi:hypothetical protein C4572_03760 [Candidatus Parcubacteria bacterium]|nr:MAG: hypothetical protein C4572_03760 [Candidatus Parcubacteria bacterium]
MRRKIVEFFLSLLLSFGIIFLFSPFALHRWIHGDYDRYLWVIRGPYPYSHLGSGPFQLVIYGGLFIFGILLIIISITARKILPKN